MPLRRGVDTIGQAPRRPPGRQTRPPENDLRVARLGLEYPDRPRLNGAASADCAERVADVLVRLGYGFNVIPRGSSAPKRA